MPEKETLERARKAEKSGKAPTTQAGEFVREEIRHIRSGKHGAFGETGDSHRALKSAESWCQTAAACEGNGVGKNTKKCCEGACRK